MKLFTYIFVAGCTLFLSCKKDNKPEIPAVATQQFHDSLFYPTSTFSFVSPAGTVSGYPNIDTVYYYLPAPVKVTSQSTLTSGFQWYLRRPSMPDSLLSTSKDPVFNFTSVIPKASIVLKASNNLGTSIVTKPFQTRSSPNGLKITSITIDTMAFVNPSNSQPWNANGWPNVFCQIFKGSSVVMDTVNGTGWSSNPGSVPKIFPVKDSLTAVPYTVKYPSSIRNFTISSAIAGVTMVDTFNIRIYNKNLTATPDLIGDVDLIPTNYFGGSLPTTIYVSNPALDIYIKLTVQWL